ncbi:Inositol-pentakisphosphate 2-kinase [Salvia divinorum]|uniref:Inositol-pentakisphosphate 2-kinase n=1 Tax=Salvia divinorum TaxID=28513 RepID=A0ABD1GSN1_SALDI
MYSYPNPNGVQSQTGSPDSPQDEFEVRSRTPPSRRASDDEPLTVGKVLRIQKVPNDRPECENGHSALLNHESLLWGKFEGIVSAPTEEIVEHVYEQKIHALVSREFLESVDNKVLCQRLGVLMLPESRDSVLLIADHSLFHHGITYEMHLKFVCNFV